MLKAKGFDQSLGSLDLEQLSLLEGCLLVVLVPEHSIFFEEEVVSIEVHIEGFEGGFLIRTAAFTSLPSG